MVESSQDSLYAMDSQDFNLDQINTGDLLSSPELNAAESILTLSPNTFNQEFQGSQIPKEIDCHGEFMMVPLLAPHHVPHQYQQFVPAHLHKLPLTDQLDTDWDFNIELNGESSGKTSWMFSTKLNKVFVKINTILNVQTNFKIVNPARELFVRAMIVYSSQNDLAEPVKKCPNHRESSQQPFPEHILRCTIDQTAYTGVENGKLFKDKLAILIPMAAVASNEPLKLQFTCQNSCSGGMNRKMTSIVFTLEDEFYEILGRKVLNFKVCSCPKRDKDKDEESFMKVLPKKRKAEQTAPSTSKKVAISVPVVKQESDELMGDSDPMMLSAFPSDLQSLNSGLLEIKHELQSTIVPMPSHLNQLLMKDAYKIVAAEMTLTGDVAAYQPYLNEIKKRIDDN